MTQRKSILNPDATPYVPLSKLSSGPRDQAAEKTMGASETNEAIADIEHQLPDSFSLDCDIQSSERLDLIGESSSKMGQHSYSAYIKEEFSDWDASNVVVDFLASMFPDISVEYLAELLAANHGDFNETIDVLQQFEYDGDGSGYPIDTAETSNNSDVDSQKPSSSGTSNSS